MTKNTLGLELPAIRKESSSAKPIILSGQEVWKLEKIIPFDPLYDATLSLEDKLRKQKNELGIRSANNDISGDLATNVDFAHVLEHAICSTVDNHLSPHQLSTGSVYNAGINLEKSQSPEYDPNVRGSKIAHLREIALLLAPSIPTHKQRAYVEQVIQQIQDQIKKTGTIDLSIIKL